MTKCGICGHELIMSFTKTGFRVLTCPNLKTRSSSVGIGDLKQIEVWCDQIISDPSKQPVKRGNPQEIKAIHSSIKHQGLKDSFNQLIGKSMLITLKASTFDIIPESDLMKQFNLAMLLELPMLKLPILFNGAILLSRTIGFNPVLGVEAISKGIGRQSRLILDNLGIVFNRKHAYQWFKEQYDLAILTELEKTKAWKEYAIKLVLEKAQDVGTPSDSELKRMRQMANEQNGLRILGDKLRDEDYKG